MIEASSRPITPPCAAFSIALLLSGTLMIGFESLPVAIWGIPWLSFVFWGLSAMLNTTLVTRMRKID